MDRAGPCRVPHDITAARELGSQALGDRMRGDRAARAVEPQLSTAPVYLP